MEAALTPAQLRRDGERDAEEGVDSGHAQAEVVGGAHGVVSGGRAAEARRAARSPRRDRRLNGGQPVADGWPWAAKSGGSINRPSSSSAMGLILDLLSLDLLICPRGHMLFVAFTPVGFSFHTKFTSANQHTMKG